MDSERVWQDAIMKIRHILTLMKTKNINSSLRRLRMLDRILQNLMLASGQKIVPEKTLIIFDEVQDCPKVINSMKYFCENAPQYHIACAGSLLGHCFGKAVLFSCWQSQLSCKSIL